MADEPCMVHVCWNDPNYDDKETLISMHTRPMVAAAALFSDLPVVPFKVKGRVFNVGDKLTLEWTPVGTDDYVVAASVCSIPITVKNLRNGKYSEEEIEFTGKRALTTTAPASLVGVAATRSIMGFYSCPEGISFVVGKQRAHNSRLLITVGDT